MPNESDPTEDLAYDVPRTSPSNYAAEILQIELNIQELPRHSMAQHEGMNLEVKGRGLPKVDSSNDVVEVEVKKIQYPVLNNGIGVLYILAVTTIIEGWTDMHSDVTGY
ncbi:hypothetical protein B0H13DRAFT_1855244 [Mycena leptocephala]|nr:hypothetical protein B0H13DRAFT_1855244 [Mycena leptocephala]